MDQEHYESITKGAAQQFSINKIYHNGMVEASGSSLDSLGTVITHNGQKFVTGLCDTQEDYEERVRNVAKTGTYINTINKSALQSRRCGSARRPSMTTRA